MVRSEYRQSRLFGDAVPASISRARRASHVKFSVDNIKLRLFMDTPVRKFDTGIKNLKFRNLSSATFSTEELRLLGRGLKFAPNLTHSINRQVFNEASRVFFCGLHLADFFHHLGSQDRDDVPPECASIIERSTP